MVKNPIVRTQNVSSSLLTVEFFLASIHNTIYYNIQRQIVSSVAPPSSLSLVNTSTDVTFMYASTIYADHVVRKCVSCWPSYSPPVDDHLVGISIQLFYAKMDSSLEEYAAPHLPPPPSPIPATVPVPILEEHNLSNVRVPETTWCLLIQDAGCTKEEIPKKTYLQSQIPPIGPLKQKCYYYGLTYIAIDYIKSFQNECKLGRGWGRLPKNRTDVKVKVKIVEIIMKLRKCQYDGRYTLSQDHLLIMLSNMWGRSKIAASIYSNDRVRVYGIVMSISTNQPWYER